MFGDAPPPIGLPPRLTAIGASALVAGAYTGIATTPALIAHSFTG